MNKYVLAALMLLLPLMVSAQELKGVVTGPSGDALINATAHWLGTTKAANTDENGAFSIAIEGIEDRRLIINYVGYQSDTFNITEAFSETIANGIPLMIQLEEGLTLDEVELTARRQDTYISSTDPIKTEVITSQELAKAACCDLAGCFNTQASVRATVTNVVTNTRELRILGLAGIYNQLLVDGFPMIQGLTYTYGIGTIPGTLVDNIFVTKGANSIMQGFEGMSGQINVITKQPDNTDRLLLNLYTNSFLEKQANVNFSHRFNDKWSTLVSAHSTQPANKFDRDGDDFLDLPLLTRYSFFNKWRYGNATDQGWHSLFSLRYVDERRVGGQWDFDPELDRGTTNSYGQIVDYTQPEFYTKTGYRFNEQHSVVFMGSAFWQDQESYFGTLKYDAQQRNIYANIQHELTWNADHVLKSGFSYRDVDLEENISFGQDSLERNYAGDYLKREHIPGFFAENTFNFRENTITVIAGARLDHHNTFGWKFTPRGLIRYQLSENTTVRASVGKGWRTLNLFSENINLMASSRDVIIREQLEPEESINYGVNLTHKIYGENVESQLTFDLYRTQFSNQIFPEYHTEPTKAIINNFRGTSVSNSFQVEAGFEFYQRVGIKMAYNYLDVYRIVEGETFDLPFNPTHRFTGTLSIKPLNEKWHFDMDLHWLGEQWQAHTDHNPREFRLPERSDPYAVINAQFTKDWPRLSLYGGVENIFDFRQRRPILSWEQPFGPYFDTSTVWGPTRGRELYIGMRWRLAYK